jgi:hypothetical protein
MSDKNLKIQGEALDIIVSSLLFMMTRHIESGAPHSQRAIVEHFSMLAKYPDLEGTALRDTCLRLEKRWSDQRNFLNSKTPPEEHESVSSQAIVSRRSVVKRH